MIRIEDADITATALTLHYILGSNSLDTVAIYATIHSLSSHPGRARVCRHEGVTPCTALFLSTFWSATASLLDYYADFHATDTPLMQSVWFSLLDTWQAASPVAVYKQERHPWPSSELQIFLRQYNDTLALLQRLIAPRAHTDKAQEPLIHTPGSVEAQTGAYTRGPFLSGLNPWQQFLYAGAPGFRPAVDKERNEDTQYVPQPAIALLAAHTARARTLCTKVNPEALSAFDAHALTFPTLTTPTS